MNHTDSFAAVRFGRAVASVRRANSSADVLAAVPGAVVLLGFERVMLSLVDEEYWRPQSVQVAADGDWSKRLLETARTSPQPIERAAPERRMIERGSPILVPPPRDVHEWSKRTWDYRHPRRITTYVGSPIMADGRVVAIVHADQGTSCAPLATSHATLLWSFCGVVELALRAATATEALASVRMHLDAAVALSSPGAVAAAPDPQPQATGADALTVRERDIIDLVARGLSNAQIAEQLVLSEGTVKSHVKHILAKTRSTNRTAAARKWTTGQVA